MAMPVTYGRSSHPNPQSLFMELAASSSHQHSVAHDIDGTYGSAKSRQPCIQTSQSRHGRPPVGSRRRLFQTDDHDAKHLPLHESQINARDRSVRLTQHGIHDPRRVSPTWTEHRWSALAKVSNSMPLRERYEMTIIELVKLKLQRSGQSILPKCTSQVGDGFNVKELAPRPPLIHARKARTPRPRRTPFKPLVLTYRSPTETSRAYKAPNSHDPPLKDDVDRMLDAISAPPRMLEVDKCDEYPASLEGESVDQDGISVKGGSWRSGSMSSLTPSSSAIDPDMSSSCVILEGNAQTYAQQPSRRVVQVLHSEAAILRTSVSS